MPRLRVPAIPTAAAIALAVSCSIACGSLGVALPAETGSAARDAALQRPEDGGTIVYADLKEPPELNCVRTSDAPAIRICRLVADTLIDVDRNLNYIPRLAESFEASPDGRTLTFHLRRGVRWHDGRPFSAADVLYTARQIRAPGAMVTGNRPALFEPMTSIESPDEYTVVARYREPFALAYQAWARTYIVPAHLPFEPGASAPADRAPVGTGPYRFVRWDPQQQIVLEANAGYFAGRPHLDRVIYRYIPDAGTHLLALKTGEVDIAAIPPNEAPADDASLPFRIVRYTPLSLTSIIWNTREPRGLFKDARVRRAMSLAFDRAGYIRDVTKGNDLPAVSSFHPAVWAHDPDLAPLPHDPNGAALLLAEAGWRDRDSDGILETPSGPAAFTLLFFSGRADHEAIATLFQSALKRLGVDVRLQGLDWAVLRDKIRGHGFEASVYAWGLDVDPDPYDFFHSSQYPSGQNYGGYSSPEVDRLAEEGRRTLNLSARATIYHRVEGILRDDQPWLFVSHPGTVLGVSRRVHGMEMGPTGPLAWFPAPLNWWIPAAEQRRSR